MSNLVDIFTHILRVSVDELHNLVEGNHLKCIGTLQARVLEPDGKERDLGIVSRRVVTQAFGDLLAQHLAGNAVTVNDFKYGSVGTGTNAPTSADTALQAEDTTNYGATRVTGTQSNPSARVYRVELVYNFTGPLTIAEHGIFNNATFGAGTMLDRSLVSPTIGVDNGYQVTFDFDLTTVA